MHTWVETFENPKRGKGKASIYLEEGRYYVMLETAKGHVDHPIRYPDGRIAYHFPERVPLYVKELVNKAYTRIVQLNIG